MAFKRESDSQDWLALLKKRRISELFAEDIPADEAILMKNGRFCCTVCPHKPIFDTAQMLAHHRQGKKHASATEKRLDQKLEIGNLIQKREHDHYVKGKELSSTHSTLGAKRQSEHHPLLTARNYEPIVKKFKLKPGERRRVLELDSTLEGAQTIAEYQRHKKQLTDKKVVSADKKVVGAYKSKRQIWNSTNSHTDSTNSHTDSSDRCNQHNGIQRHYTNNAVNTTNTSEIANSATGFDSQSTVIYVHPKNNKRKPKQLHKSREPESAPSEMEMQKRKTTELYLQARGAGWKISLDGTWVRDEDVEFDSDDEPPDIP